MSEPPKRKETEEERRARKEKEKAQGGGRREETEDERRARKEKERAERPKETEEERRIRKEKEKERGSERPKETDEERRARKEKERAEGRPKETEEERRIRKEKEKERASERPKETEEERRVRKEKERAEGGARKEETEEERRVRKEKERAEGPKETDEERRIRKEKERTAGGERPKESDEERKARKEKERADKEQKEREKAQREVVHKPLPAARNAAAAPPARASPAPEKPVVVAPPRAQATQPEDDDDYEDDFEENVFDGEAIAEAQRAVVRENAATKAASSSVAKEPEVQGESRAGLDTNSLHRQKARAQFEKDLARASTLRRLVDLDVAGAAIADFPPMTEYDLFIRSFGGAGAQQAACQAPPETDRAEVEVQAERIHSKQKACQCPADLGLFPERMASATMAAARGGDDEAQRRPTTDSAALSTFLGRVFPVVRTLLDENEAERNPLQRRASISSHSFSTSVLPLQFAPMGSRPVLDICFNRLTTQYLLVVYGPPTGAGVDYSQELNNYAGVALLWNVNDPRAPDKVLVSHAELTAGCLSSTRAHLVYAGTAVGSVCAWDTREPDHAHGGGGGAYTCRVPSFSTDWNLTDNHAGPVVKLCVAGYNSIMGVHREESEQLVSLDDGGGVQFWMIGEADRGAAGSTISDTEHGQHIFSVVRIFKASAMAVPALDSDRKKASDTASGSLSSNRRTFDLEFVPTDASHIVVAADTCVMQLSRFGSIAAPSAYLARSHWGTPSPATTLHYSPTDSRVLVAGFNDGSLRLFLKDDPHPQVVVPLSSAQIRRVRCNTSTKWVTYALDGEGTFYIVDFAASNKTVPVAKSELRESKAGRCTSMDVSAEEKSETKVALGYATGLVEVHSLNDKVIPMAHRNDKWR